MQEDLLIIARLCPMLEALGLLYIPVDDENLAELTCLSPHILYLELANNDVVTDAESTTTPNACPVRLLEAH